MSDPSFFDQVGTQARPRNREAAVSEPRKPRADSGQSYPPVSALGNITIRRWSHADDVYWPASDTVESLPPAFYRFDDRPHIGPCLIQKPMHTDSLIRLPDAGGDLVLRELETFWKLKSNFLRRGFLHKRGVLLWGPPGSGKTCMLMQVSADIIDRGGIVCQIEQPELAAICLALIRKIEPERPIVALIEDLDALVERFGENQYLALLDGETQVGNIVYVATTNYPERLDARFVDRPSRFDTVQWIGMPSAAARRAYLRAKEPDLSDAELDEWAARTEGYSVAHLRELVILVKCFEQSLDAAIDRLDSMKVRRPSSTDAPDKQAFGIVGRSELSRGAR